MVMVYGMKLWACKQQTDPVPSPSYQSLEKDAWPEMYGKHEDPVVNPVRMVKHLAGSFWNRGKVIDLVTHVLKFQLSLLEYKPNLHLQICEHHHYERPLQRHIEQACSNLSPLLPIFEDFSAYSYPVSASAQWGQRFQHITQLFTCPYSSQ